MNKKQAVIGASSTAVAALTAAVMLFTGETNPEGGYKLVETSSISSKVVVTLPYDKMPEATFYSLTFGDSLLGMSPFGDEFGVNTVKNLLNPPTGLSLTVFDRERNPIGVGILHPDGRVTVTESEAGE